MTDATTEMRPLHGLSALMRMAFSGQDLTPLAQELMARSAADPNDAEALLDLAIIMQLIGNRDLGLGMLAQALEIRQHFRLPSAREPAAIRLLAIMAPGEIMANTPLEFLLEQSDVALDLLYVGRGLPFPAQLPEHDLLFVAVGESDDNRPTLELIEQQLKSAPRPVLNRPERITQLSRNRASALLHNLPGVEMPLSERVARQSLETIANGRESMESVLASNDFPVVIRPVGSHAGHSFEKVDDPQALSVYLQANPDGEFYVTRFVDYRGADGLFRKYRVVLVEGKPFLAHMAISSNWMVHYLNAEMAESSEKRAEEAREMEGFDSGFAKRHEAALAAVTEKLGLDYYGLDCAETTDGKLLIFEVDSALVVHDMDPVDLFPYKHPKMQRIFAAFREMLGRRRG